MATRATRLLLGSQFTRFCAVGASGYAVNLAVYAALLAAGLHYLAAAAVAFLVAAASKYAWNRAWTFRTSVPPSSARARAHWPGGGTSVLSTLLGKTLTA